MGTLQSGIELYDGFSAPLYSIINALNLTVSAFEDMQRISGNQIDTSSIDGARAAADEATMAFQAMQDELSRIGATGGTVTAPTVSPVEAPIVWKSDTLDVFTNSGIERFQQEIQSATNMVNTLNQAQQWISAQAAATNIFPPNAVTDLNNMQNRIQALQTRITQIANNPINIGSDTANRELERLRAQLDQAIAAQEALNGAVENMDVQAANDAYNRLSQIVGGTERNIRDNVDEQGRFNDAINEGANAAQNLSDIIQKAVAGFTGIAGIKKAFDYIQNSTDLFNTQLNAEIQLSTVLGNMLEDNVGGAFDAITAKASEIQGRGIYGDEAMIAGAAELATYFSDADAILSMMDTLSNYAMGMSGGGAVDTTAMVDYATGIGKIMSGSYGAMTKKGFEFSDAQKAIIEGTATEAQIVSELGEEYLTMSADMQGAAAINNVIAEGWGGLYEAMSNTPQGKIIQLSNAYGDLKEQVGMGVYPFIIKIVDAINNNWGTIEVIISNVTAGLQLLVGILGWIAEGAINAGTAVIDNWSWISPIVYGVVAALAVYAAYMGIVKGIEIASAAAKGVLAVAEGLHAAAVWATTTATWAEVTAQNGLNAAMYACPIVWIIALVIALIAVFYAAVAAVNKFAGTSVSATGIICGVFTTAAAFVGNLFVILINFVIDIFVVLWNFIAAFANFFGNVFNDPVGAIARLFFDLVDTVLSLLQTLASAIDTLFGSDLAGAVQGWRDSLSGWVDDTFGQGEEIMATLNAEDMHLDRFEYGDAWNAGYEFGQGIEDTISNFSMNDLFGVEQMNMEDYISAYDAAGNGLTSDVSDIAGNTGSIADSLDVTDEELKYLRDIAERDTINRFTIAEVAVDMGGITNQVSGPADLDGLVDGLVDGVNEAIDIVTEGVHT